MEYTLGFKVDKILNKSVIYTLNDDEYTLDKEPYTESQKKSKNLGKIRVKVAYPDFHDQQRNVTSGTYEGGYTIWESTWVLLAFLDKLDIKSGLEVLELGSGIGVCGTFLSLRDHKVTFQDLNLKVIEKGLVPNLLLNHGILDYNDKYKTINVNLKTPYNDQTNKTYQIRTNSVNLGDNKVDFQFVFLVGDWNQLLNTVDICKNLENKFDLIISSECIYRIENYNSIVKIILRFLKDSGSAYIATKRFYFGLSGGTFQFMQFIKEFNYQNYHKLTSKIIKSVEPKNSSNVIDLIEVTKEPFSNKNNL